MPSFDTVLEPDHVKIRNGVDNAIKEIGTRFDFKGTGAKVELKDKEIHATGDSEFQLEQIEAVLYAKLTKQDVVISFLDKQDKIDKLGGDKVRQVYKIKEGIASDLAKKIVSSLKESKLKVQASIQGDAVRVTGKNRDDLQTAIAHLKKSFSDTPLTYNNFPGLSMRRVSPVPLLLACGLATAQGLPPGQVHLNGMLGARSALLIIDGEPRTIEVGASAKGVKLISLEDGHAVVEYGGRRQTLTLGAAPGRVVPQTPAPRQISLPMGPGGHFTSIGTINGQVTSFLVDTGATSVTISQIEAEKLGLRYMYGKRMVTMTANGVVPAYQIQLGTVRLGDVEVRDIEAIVIPGTISHVLLGNSFLNRFQMRRENDVMTLELRY